jgi:hypothetical protein
MATEARPVRIRSSTGSATLADILERVLDAGVVLAGDIKIKIVDIELLTIQIRLVLASVDKAREIGLDWWMNEPAFCSKARRRQPREASAVETVLTPGAKVKKLKPGVAGPMRRRRAPRPPVVEVVTVEDPQ